MGQEDGLGDVCAISFRLGHPNLKPFSNKARHQVDHHKTLSKQNIDVHVNIVL